MSVFHIHGANSLWVLGYARRATDEVNCGKYPVPWDALRQDLWQVSRVVKKKKKRESEQVFRHRRGRILNSCSFLTLCSLGQIPTQWVHLNPPQEALLARDLGNPLPPRQFLVWDSFPPLGQSEITPFSELLVQLHGCTHTEFCSRKHRAAVWLYRPYRNWTGTTKRRAKAFKAQVGFGGSV